MIAVLGKEGEVEHCSESHVIIILVVNRVTKIVRLVVCRIIDAIEIVLHVLVGAVFVGIVQGSEHAECSSAEHPALVQAGCQFQVAQRLLVLDEPIIIESVAQKRSSIIAHRFPLASSCGFKSAWMPPFRFLKPLSNPRKSVPEPFE